uniref:Uncharacterized protein n=1 Tax=Paramoeba aestuarina TaxID=180227 RepID=A0A7S4PC47_9EUKA
MRWTMDEEPHTGGPTRRVTKLLIFLVFICLYRIVRRILSLQAKYTNSFLVLGLRENSFDGSLTIGEFPKDLVKLDVSNNAISGEIHLTEIQARRVNTEDTKVEKTILST